MMALVEASQTHLVVAQKGALYEVSRSQLGALRVDWTRLGAVSLIIVGPGSAEYAPLVLRHWDEALRSSSRISLFADFSAMRSYDNDLRIGLTDWCRAHRDAVEGLHVLTGSSLVTLGLTVANIPLRGLITVHTKRADYDLLVKKHALPVNPGMPA